MSLMRAGMVLALHSSRLLKNVRKLDSVLTGEDSLMEAVVCDAFSYFSFFDL